MVDPDMPLLRVFLWNWWQYAPCRKEDLYDSWCRDNYSTLYFEVLHNSIDFVSVVSPFPVFRLFKVSVGAHLILLWGVFLVSLSCDCL